MLIVKVLNILLLCEGALVVDKTSLKERYLSKIFLFA